MRPGLSFRGWLELRGERRRSRSAQPGGLPGNPGTKRGTDRVQPQRPLDRERGGRGPARTPRRAAPGSRASSRLQRAAPAAKPSKKQAPTHLPAPPGCLRPTHLTPYTRRRLRDDQRQPIAAFESADSQWPLRRTEPVRTKTRKRRERQGRRLRVARGSVRDDRMWKKVASPAKGAGGFV